MCSPHRSACILLSTFLLASPAFAAWPNSPFTNLPVSIAANSQSFPTIVSDGAGGAVITWQDDRSAGYSDIYAGRVLASGAVDPAWPAQGRALCTASDRQEYPRIASDGAGGAVVTWQDNRNGVGFQFNYDIFAQRVLASGAVDPAWTANGVALCTSDYDQANPAILSDGAGGAFVAWQDYRAGLGYDLYTQHVLGSGVVDPAWPVNGLAVCTATNDQVNARLAADGAGGVVVTWLDNRGTSYDIYAQHVRSSGTTDPYWPTNGVAMCTATGNQMSSTIVTDGAGGAIVTWQDYRSGGDGDVYAQHVLTTGSVDPVWPADGRLLCSAASNQVTPMVVSDDAAGAIVAWVDARSGGNDIYAQHVLASGVKDPAWPADGRALCTASGDQDFPAIVADGAGGALVAWNDPRGGSYDVYAHHVLVSGAVDPAWPADGRSVTVAGNGQAFPMMASDGAAGAIVTWMDSRTGSGNSDIYAQRVARYGYLGTPEAVIASVMDVSGDQGGKVMVSWYASYLEGDPYSVVTSYKVFRAVPTSAAAVAVGQGALVIDLSEDMDPAPSGDEGALFTTSAAGTTYFWEYLASVATDYVATYSYVAFTTQDSTSAGAPETMFMVQARTAGTQHWESQPLGGYSVDDLAPLAPAPFTGTYASGTATLHWGVNTEADLAGYRLYRGTSASFVPGPANLVAAQRDVDYADVALAPYYYKLTAVDLHGNESPAVLLLPLGALAVDGAAPAMLSFPPPQPNPAHGATTLGFALPREAHVRLSIYDTAGRRVRLLVDGASTAGGHCVTWNVRDDNGHALGAGLYFATLEAEGRRLTQRVLTLR